jgi:hypothetical protein
MRFLPEHVKWVNLVILMNMNKSELNNYARYSNIAIQMGVVIVGGVLGGHYLDVWIGWKFPVLTLFLSFFSVALAMYLVIKGLNTPKHEK